MQIMTLIAALPGAVAQGLIWGIMAIGVYLTFRILDIADLTVDGTMCTGGSFLFPFLSPPSFFSHFSAIILNTGSSSTGSSGL